MNDRNRPLQKKSKSIFENFLIPIIFLSRLRQLGAFIMDSTESFQVII